MEIEDDSDNIQIKSKLDFYIKKSKEKCQSSQKSLFKALKK